MTDGCSDHDPRPPTSTSQLGELAPRRRPRGRGRRGRRPARPQRRRQDHGAAHAWPACSRSTPAGSRSAIGWSTTRTPACSRCRSAARSAWCSRTTCSSRTSRVLENVAFGPRSRGVGKAEARAAADAVARPGRRGRPGRLEAPRHLRRSGPAHRARPGAGHRTRPAAARRAARRARRRHPHDGAPRPAPLPRRLRRGDGARHARRARRDRAGRPGRHPRVRPGHPGRHHRRGDHPAPVRPTSPTSSA